MLGSSFSTYPWWRFVLSFALAAFVFSAIVTAIVHYTMGGLRFGGHVAADTWLLKLTFRSWLVWRCW